MRYWLPEVPSTPVDIVNRTWAAQGSMHLASMAAYADYNGHHVNVSFKPHAVSGPTWNCEYWWAGRVVLARGTLQQCARAGREYWLRKAAGSVVHVSTSEEAPESIERQVEILVALGYEPYPEVPAGERAPLPAWWTGAHTAVLDAVGWQRRGEQGLVQVALQFKGTPEEWPAVRDAWLLERSREIQERRAALDAAVKARVAPPVEARVHVFEQQGLGKAPFVVRGFGVEAYSPVPGVEMVGASCASCGQGIKYVCYVESSDKRKFKVGMDCVLKTGDAGLRRVVNREKARLDAEKRAATGRRQRAELACLLVLPEVRARLSKIGHPMISGKSLLDYVEYLHENAGDSGVRRALKLIKQTPVDAHAEARRAEGEEDDPFRRAVPAVESHLRDEV